MIIHRDKVLLICDSIPALGYKARKTPKKQEYELVRGFVDRYISSLKPGRYKIAIFFEPMVDSGYPDIVIIKYSTDADIVWQPHGGKLTNRHYKVLSAVDQKGRIGVTDLASLLGYEEKDLRTILNRLSKEGLVIKHGEVIHRRKYADYYSIHSIITVEAKVNKWAEAIDQALINTRFSTESYVLMDTDRCSDAMRERCESLGIGIFLSANNRTKRYLQAEKRRKTSSYIPYLFNEWILRIERSEASDVTE